MFREISAKKLQMSQNLQNFVKFQTFQLENLVDFEKCCKTHIYIQKSVPIQPKTSNILPKICQTLAIPYGSLAAAAATGLRGRGASARVADRAGLDALVSRQSCFFCPSGGGGRGSGVLRGPSSVMSTPNCVRKAVFCGIVLRSTGLARFRTAARDILGGFSMVFRVGIPNFAPLLAQGRCSHA